MKNLKITESGIRRKGGYGQYEVYGIVNGVEIKGHSTNSEAFDWINDDDNMEKHLEAIDYVESFLIRLYEDQN